MTMTYCTSMSTSSPVSGREAFIRAIQEKEAAHRKAKPAPARPRSIDEIVAATRAKWKATDTPKQHDARMRGLAAVEQAERVLAGPPPTPARRAEILSCARRAVASANQILAAPAPKPAVQPVGSIEARLAAASPQLLRRIVYNLGADCGALAADLSRSLQHIQRLEAQVRR
jgi:hypothetical protein